jgi:preprotein translocase subunit SecD
VLVLLSAIYAVPNLYPQDPAVQISANRGNRVDGELKERVQGALEKSSTAFKQIEIEGERLMVRLDSADAQLRVSDALRGELGDGYNVALNLASTVPDWLLAIRATPMLLGLDLQGGVHFLMEVDERAALEKRENGFADDIRSTLRTADVRYT